MGLNDVFPKTTELSDVSPEKTSLISLFEALQKIFCIIIAATGIAVLIGWALDIEVFKSIAPGFVSMKANTALCFVLLGIAILFKKKGGGIAKTSNLQA